MNYYLSRVYYKINQAFFNYQIKAILETKPIEYRYNKHVAIISMVHHAALDMYLVAIKSFLYYFCTGSVYVLNDGSLTDEDVRVLEYHIPNIVIENISKVDTDVCPKGGCWERLFYLIELSQNAYVIQLDSDTLTRAPLFDVHDAIEHQRGFTIASHVWNKPVSVDYLGDIVRNWSRNWSRIHVQPAAEAVFHQMDFFHNDRRYIRGCAAFTGFPMQQASREGIIEFSSQVSEIIGHDKWSEWGSEQVTSNVLVTRTNDAFALPWPLYQNYKNPQIDQRSVLNASFIHFMGSERFQDRCYEQLAMQFIKLLQKST